LGAAVIAYNTLHDFTPEEVERAEHAGHHIALALWTFRQSIEIQQRLKESNTLAKIERALSETERIGTRKVLQLIVDSARELMPHAQKSVIHLLEPDEQLLVARAISGVDENKEEIKAINMRVGEGVAGHVILEGETVLIKDIKTNPKFILNESEPTFRSLMVAPVQIGGQPTGTISVQSSAKNAFSTKDANLLNALAVQSAIAIENSRLLETLQRSLEEEKRVRAQLLQSERLALVGRLLASVSHEINNPLQAIQYGLFLLRDEATLSHQARQDVDVLIAEAERITALIERLRGSYRPVNIKDYQSIQLNSLIQDVYALISTYMRHREITFQFTPAPEMANISGWPDQIRQVVLNLFLNAIDVMQPGGSLTVSTQYFPQQREVMVSVKDTGPGIDPEIMPHIFDAFITNKDTGTGLGLAITHDIIQQHHGRIEAENDPETGAIFRIWFPIEERS
jgi:signal transduction histidine kinase